MRRIMTVLCGILILASGRQAEAQDGGYPFVRYPTGTPNYTKEQLATAIENNVRSVLNADCMVIVRSAMRYVGFDVDTCAELAREIRNAEVRACEPGSTQYANIVRRGQLNTVGRVGTPRTCRRGETWLYRDNSPFMSLQCGNWILDRVAPSRQVDEPGRIPERHETFARTDTTVVNVNLGDLVIRDERAQQVYRPSFVERYWKPALAAALLGGAIGWYCHSEGCGNRQTVIIR